MPAASVRSSQASGRRTPTAITAPGSAYPRPARRVAATTSGVGWRRIAYARRTATAVTRMAAPPPSVRLWARALQERLGHAVPSDRLDGPDDQLTDRQPERQAERARAEQRWRRAPGSRRVAAARAGAPDGARA